MKTIGMLGGAGWASTVDYYRQANLLVSQRLGGHHSAKILLKSIDYHEIMSAYGQDEELICNLLLREIRELLALKPDCFMICCNSLHKFYDLIKEQTDSDIPVVHALEKTALHIKKNFSKQTILLLGAKFTLLDGFFERALRNSGIDVVTPSTAECEDIHSAHLKLLAGDVTNETKYFFRDLVLSYKNKGASAVVLGCTEFPMALSDENSPLPLINPADIQVDAAVQFVLAG